MLTRLLITTLMRWFNHSFTILNFPRSSEHTITTHLTELSLFRAAGFLEFIKCLLQFVHLCLEISLESHYRLLIMSLKKPEVSQIRVQSLHTRCILTVNRPIRILTDLTQSVKWFKVTYLFFSFSNLYNLVYY